MNLSHLLFTQGFGTRRECDGRVQLGQVRWQGQCITDPDHDVGDPTEQDFEVEGVAWRYQAKALLMLHKPAGFECSHKPKAWPSVLSVLPLPLRRRGVQCVGRLDQDTTGLLLLTDDGQLLHKLTSPKHQTPKIYEAQVKHPLDDAQIRALLAGVTLHDDPKPVRAADAQILEPHLLKLTLTEGKYHQVKRMVAAVGNRVEMLHRSAIGDLVLPPDLPKGGWQWVKSFELLLTQRSS
jgi:16S rRNA pseudouridine516 synthase